MGCNLEAPRLVGSKFRSQIAVAAQFLAIFVVDPHFDRYRLVRFVTHVFDFSCVADFLVVFELFDPFFVVNDPKVAKFENVLACITLLGILGFRWITVAGVVLSSVRVLYIVYFLFARVIMVATIIIALLLLLVGAVRAKTGKIETSRKGYGNCTSADGRDCVASSHRLFSTRFSMKLVIAVHRNQSCSQSIGQWPQPKGDRWQETR
ncbi:hypothetical protein Natoc_4090 (plasmid) [Natronococcus occultus SP4]|uniref:Uncharacterized protein n=1 Tax=Natronococcus occultus SP4 TaxID=694430 RepID=L0K6R8_9EURY|nr:hypothetical protein Natoc_4090 [Natronococcus occultus SP4]